MLGRYRKQAGSLSADPIPMIVGFLAVLAKAARDPGLTPAESGAIARQCVLQRAQLSLEKGRKAFLTGDSEMAIRELTQANLHFKSAKLSMVLLALRVAPQFLQALYQWRDRHIYKLKPEC